MDHSLAYYDWGRWVAECPVPACGDALAVYDENGQRQTTDRMCANGHRFTIDMPPLDQEQAIVQAVAARPSGAQQAWYPDGLALAIDAGLPQGQSIAELQEETQAMVTEAQDTDTARAEALRAALEAAGITVSADGTFAGQL